MLSGERRARRVAYAPSLGFEGADGGGTVYRFFVGVATDSRGQSLVEFSLVALMLVMLLLGVLEVGRLVVVYTALANAAKEGARYAVVHGSDSASPATLSSVQTAVQSFLSAAPLNASNATINATWPDSNCMNPGCHVTVTVSYSYDPLVSYYQWANIQLGSTSEGVITW